MKKNVGGVTLGMLALTVSLAAAGCSSSSPTAPTTSTTSASAPSTASPSFAQQIQAEILTPACTACHTDEGRTPSAGMNLKAGAAYANLVGVASSGKPGATRVIAGNASGSYLVQKLEGAPDIVGLRMPRNGPPYLTDAQVALIRLWIQNGARNN
jgi:mono/diheme cytochrome c family protein